MAGVHERSESLSYLDESDVSDEEFWTDSFHFLNRSQNSFAFSDFPSSSSFSLRERAFSSIFGIWSRAKF